MSTAAAIDPFEHFNSLDELKQIIEAEATAYFRHDEPIYQACQLLSQDAAPEARTILMLQGIDLLRHCEAISFIPKYFQQWASNDHDAIASIMGQLMGAAIEGNTAQLIQLNERVDRHHRVPDRDIKSQIQAAFGGSLANAILSNMRPKLRVQGLTKVEEAVSRLQLTRRDVADLADEQGVSDCVKSFIRCIEQAWRKAETASVLIQSAPTQPQITIPQPTRQRRNVNARMLETMTINNEAAGWTCRKWKEHLKCAQSSVASTATWKRLELQREQARLDKQPDRRGRNIRTGNRTI